MKNKKLLEAQRLKKEKIQLVNEKLMKESFSIMASASFHKENYKKSIIILLLNFLSLIVVVLFFFYVFFVYQTPSKYLVVDNQGSLIENVPLEKPVLTKADVSQWVSIQVKKALSSDYVNHADDILNLRPIFDQAAFLKWASAWQGSPIYKFMRKNRGIVSSIITIPPEVEQDGVYRGTYVWRLKGRVIIESKSSVGNKRWAQEYKVIVRHASYQESPDRLLISSMILMD